MTTAALVTSATAYRSDLRPDMVPFEESLGSIRGFTYKGSLVTEIAAGTTTGTEALDLLDDMLAIREVEEMIVRLRSGGYDPLPGYDYRGPTHVSIGQEASPVGASTALRADDNVTSSHRGHGDAIAKGFAAIRRMSDGQLRARRAPRGGPRGTRLPGGRRALRQGGGLLPRARRRNAHR
jgi:2-oxoisovalerate dehydrogenase E1 component